jgi:hypothetical protein
MEWKMLLSFMTISNILRPFGIIYGLLVQFVVIWYIFTFWHVWTEKNLATLLRFFFCLVMPQSIRHHSRSLCLRASPPGGGRAGGHAVQSLVVVVRRF